MTAQRVVVWATGGIGSIAIHAVQKRPNLDLVGVWVHSPDKDGKDPGDLANGEPIGLKATNDADALIALKPDCVIYAASGPERDALAIPQARLGFPSARKKARLTLPRRARAKAPRKMRAALPFFRSASVRPLARIHGRAKRMGEYQTPP